MRLRWRFGRGLGAPIFEGGIARHVGEQVLAHRLELVSTEVEAKQEDTEVILGARGVEGALATRCRASVQGLGGEGEAEGDIGAHLARVEGGLKPAKLHRAAIPDVMQVHAVVAGRAVVLRMRVVIAVPDAVKFVLRLRALSFHAPDEFRIDWACKPAEPFIADAEGVQDERLLLINDLGKVAQAASVEGRGINVDVHAALRVYLCAATADGADDFLKLLQVFVLQDRGYDLGAQVEGHVAERCVSDHFPMPPVQVHDLPGVVTVGLADVSDRTANHRVDGPGHLLPRPLYRFNLDPESYLVHVHRRFAPLCSGFLFLVSGFSWAAASAVL